ncbi:hypothetical protein BDN72DRAFT_960636 [Pluteus cervinus]|uniref:Uncharacterized protein n=1 Tax=Pluteus cervinus TaxID=181527 RepID=A0ACD3AQ87_9AGAR|nr:hypothetical protein BDN72DRAFT_960636 [Pluteus cervinus]
MHMAPQRSQPSFTYPPHFTHPLRTTPINHLPPELLTEIFLHIRRLRTDHRFFRRVRDRPSWTVVTGVCRLWRNVALRSPSLWSYISSSYPSPILERWLLLSKPAPLTIDLYLYSKPVPPFLAEVVSRIRHLNVRLPGQAWQEFRSSLSDSAPLLESLSVSLSDNYTSKEPKNLDSLFGGTTPPLRHFSVDGCEVDLTSSFFSNLTVLEMRNPKPPFSTSKLLSALRKLPLLISLQLSTTFQPANVGTALEIGTVNLPSLALLSLHGSPYTQDLDFLSHLSFPSTTTLLFASGHPFHYTTPIAAVVEFLQVYSSARLPGGTFIPSKVDLFTLYGRLKLDIHCRNKILCALKFDSEDGQGGDRHEIQPHPDVHQMFSCLTFSTITKFSTNCLIETAVWPIMSSSFPALDFISVKGEGEEASIFKAIIQDYRDPTFLPSDLWAPIFPRLRTLFLERVHFDDDCQKPELLMALRVRKDFSSGLEYIDFTECYGIRRDLVLWLKRVRGMRVDWDEWDDENDEFDPDAYIDDYVEINAEESGEIELGRGTDFDPLYVDSYIFGDI